ncbi:MAG: type I-B CRISPR-associated protein Cas5b [Thermodesulfobacteriota bacterium]|nr:type I-B CRISPR-associated protein Cas5b [Thermodesulfobacteriota bacterium]
MKVYRIHITSWTASFRYPNLISGYQPSLAVPPLSTIYGLIASALGNYISPYDMALGYVFNFGSQSIDLETIYQITSKSSPLKTKQNIIRRQILFDNNLWLYVQDSSTAKAFIEPQFQLLLGRSSDLASVISVEEIEIQQLKKLTALKGTTVPMGTIPLSAPIQALPLGFTDEIPRRGIGTRPFFLLEYDYKQPESINECGFFDSELGHEIYWHDYKKTK